MTSESKPIEHAEPGTTEPAVSAKPDDEVCRESARAFREQAEVVRRLAHRAVDLIVDCGCHKLLTAAVVDSLTFIPWSEEAQDMTDFLEQSGAEEKRC